MGFWPLYRENILQGPSHVSLALPGIPSAISKSVNGTMPALLLVPNLDFLKSFVEGDLGIAQGIITNSLFTNLNSPLMANNEMLVRNFAKSNGIDLGEIEKYRNKEGKIKIPKSAIKIPDEYNMEGLKALEKTIIKSIFETQKPYIEIAKIVLDSLVDCEDIIARVMPLLSLSPLTAKSKKPTAKDGSNNGTRAIGYKGGEEIKKIMAQLEKVSTAGGKTKVNSDGTVTRDKSSQSRRNADAKYGTSDLSSKDLTGTGKEWKIISTVYSTGKFDPNVEYSYTYNLLPPDDEGTTPTPEAPEEDNPFDKHKPKKIILGIFDSDGSPLDPNQTLKTIGISGNELTKVDTQVKAADWILRSPKWKFAENEYKWPSMGGASGEPVYLWTNATGATSEGKKSPGKGWSLKKYKKGDKNLINKVDATEGDPIIVRFEASDAKEYSNYFTEYTRLKAKSADGLTQTEKDDVVKGIMAGFDIQSHMQNVFLYGSAKSSTYKSPGIPEALKIAFKPHQIYVPSAATDPNLSGDGMVWIDPEADYDMKVIRIDPVSKVDYESAKGEPTITADVKSFIKNKMVFSLSNSANFSIAISKNGQTETEFNGVTEYILENWNYENGKIKNQNSFQVTIWSDKPVPKYSDGKNKYVFDNTFFLPDLEKQTAKLISDTLDEAKELSKKMSILKVKEFIEEKTKSIVGFAEKMRIEYSIRKEVEKNASGQWTYREYLPSGEERKADGLNFLEDKSRVEVKNGIITKWYYLYKKEYNKSNLPNFGNEITQVINYESIGREKPVSTFHLPSNSEPKIDSTTKTIPLYQIKVTNPTDKYGVIIDANKVRNDALTTPDLFSNGRYGAGTPESPQEIEVIKRYALTDLDTKSYYVIEGILIDENAKRGAASTSGGTTNANASGESSKDWYRLPHAIGAAVVFLKLMVRIAVKLSPEIKKLMNLFSNPTKFVTDIIEEKLGESFSVFSKESFDKFKEIRDLMGKKDEIIEKRGRVSDYTNQLRQTVKSSPFANLVYVQEFFKPGKIYTLPDGVATIPFEIFGKSFNFGMELKLSNLIPEGTIGGTLPKIPLGSIKGLKVGDLKMGNLVPGGLGGEIPKSPFKLVFGMKDSARPIDWPETNTVRQSDQPASGNADSGKTNKDYLNELNSATNYKNTDKRGQSRNQNDFYTTSTWYSTGRFIKGVDYNYLYVTDDTSRLLSEVDELISGEYPSQENLQAASEKIDDALKKDPDNEALKEKQKEIKSKGFDLSKITQPLLKLILGVVTLPIKIISKIVEWLLNFFKSLVNPLTLPKKIIEFLSFKWIMEFFSPKGILKMAGIEFNPAIAKEYASLSKLPNSPDFSASGATSESKKGGFPSSGKNFLKGIAPHKGKYALPDNFPLADLSKVIKITFMAKLPTYSSKNIRENPDLPSKFSGPTLCFMEKVINAFIDFVWSTLGIEAIIPPPHIKICQEKSPEMTAALLNGEKPNASTANTAATSGTATGTSTEGPATAASLEKDAAYPEGTTEVVSTDPYEEKKATDPFIYEVKLPDGKVVTLMDKEALDRFIQENKDISYDFQF